MGVEKQDSWPDSDYFAERVVVREQETGLVKRNAA